MLVRSSIGKLCRSFAAEASLSAALLLVLLSFFSGTCCSSLFNLCVKIEHLEYKYKNE